ncbi:UNVERIFIED_CONTAM: hypothetical protein Sradi_1529500 [Sesamum radiatum]|uniref:Uncharacterized protein n=1 Tax=Sesamum radiatum TaxID=300843 RepID=A0AAW2U836_SESRA
MAPNVISDNSSAEVSEKVLCLRGSTTGPTALGGGGTGTGADPPLGVARHFNGLLLVRGVVRILHRNSRLELKLSTDGAN